MSFASHPMVAGHPYVGGIGMGLTLDSLCLKSARTLVLALWLHLLLVLGLVYVTQSDPVPPAALMTVLA